MKKPKGISLIMLIITVIVMLILTGISVQNIVRNEPIENAKELNFKVNASNYRSELSAYILEQHSLSYNYDTTDFYAGSWDGNDFSVPGSVKQYITIMNPVDGPKYAIEQGRLVYIGDNVDESNWAQSIGIVHEYVKEGLQAFLDVKDTKSYYGINTTWFDLSGKQNNATLINFPTYNSNDGGSLSFNGTDQECIFGNSNLIFRTNYFTFMVWAKSTGSVSTNPRAILISKDSNYIDINFNNQTYANITSQEGLTYQTLGDSSAEIGVWRCYALTFDGSYIKIYENGILTGQTNLSSFSAIKNTNSILTIGALDEGGYYLKGNISTVQVYEQALSLEAIRQNYETHKQIYGY